MKTNENNLNVQQSCYDVICKIVLYYHLSSIHGINTYLFEIDKITVVLM